jgi:hypothetical protein
MSVLAIKTCKHALLAGIMSASGFFLSVLLVNGLLRWEVIVMTSGTKRVVEASPWFQSRVACDFVFGRMDAFDAPLSSAKWDLFESPNLGEYVVDAIQLFIQHCGFMSVLSVGFALMPWFLSSWLQSSTAVDSLDYHKVIIRTMGLRLLPLSFACLAGGVVTCYCLTPRFDRMGDPPRLDELHSYLSSLIGLCTTGLIAQLCSRWRWTLVTLSAEERSIGSFQCRSCGYEASHPICTECGMNSLTLSKGTHFLTRDRILCLAPIGLLTICILTGGYIFAAQAVTRYRLTNFDSGIAWWYLSRWLCLQSDLGSPRDIQLLLPSNQTMIVGVCYSHYTVESFHSVSDDQLHRWIVIQPSDLSAQSRIVRLGESVVLGDNRWMFKGDERNSDFSHFRATILVNRLDRKVLPDVRQITLLPRSLSIDPAH